MNHKTIEATSALLPASSAPGAIVDPRQIPIWARESEQARGRLMPMLRRHRLKIGLVFALFVTAAWSIGWLQTPLYRAKTILEVQGVNREFLDMKDLEPTTSSRSAESFLSTQTKLLQTEGLARRVAARTSLMNNRVFFRQSPAMAKLRRILHLPETAFPVQESATVNKLQERINVKAEGDSDLISITVDTPEPELSAELANQISNEYSEQEQEARWTANARVGKWLSTQLEDLRLKLQQSENDLQQYANSAGLLITDEHNNVADEKLRQVQQDLSRSQADRAEKQSQMDLISSAPADSLSLVLDDGPMRDLKVRLAELRRQYAELSVTLTPSHYKVERVGAQIAALESELASQRNTIVKRIRNEYQAAVTREKLLQDAYRNQARVVSDQAARAVRYNMLKHEVDTNRTLYNSMLQKVKETSVLSAMRSNSVRVVDAAQVPDSRYRPNNLKNLGIGLIAATLCSALLVLACERANRSIREPGEALRLQIRELGVIPSARFDPRARTFFEGDGSRRPAGVIHRAALSIEAPSEKKGHLDQRLVTWTNSRSLMAEAFRSTALSLNFASNPGSAAQVIVFTSPHPKAGKSTTAANLAIAMADRKRKVLLIDGDLRRPHIHELFGTPLRFGLAEVLCSGTEIADYDLSTVRTTPIAGLEVISAGGAGRDPALLESDRLPALLSRLRAEYQVILIDSPPLMQLPDTRLIAKCSDGVVLVCRAGKTSLEHVAECCRLLEGDGARVLGAILNDWDPRAENPEYYRLYYSSYAPA